MSERGFLEEMVLMLQECKEEELQRGWGSSLG